MKTLDLTNRCNVHIQLELLELFIWNYVPPYNSIQVHFTSWWNDLFKQRWTPPLFHLPLGPYPRSFINNSGLLRWAAAWTEAARMVSSSSHYPPIVYCLSWRNENEPSSRDKKKRRCHEMTSLTSTTRTIALSNRLGIRRTDLSPWCLLPILWQLGMGPTYLAPIPWDAGIGCCCNSHYQPSVFPGGPAQCTTSRNLRELPVNEARELPPFIHEMAMSPPRSTITSFSLLTFKNCVVFSSFCNNCHSPDINYISSVAGFIHSKK